MEYLDTVKEIIADYIARDEVIENDDMFYIIVSDYRTMTKQDRIDEEIDKAFQKIYEKK